MAKSSLPRALLPLGSLVAGMAVMAFIYSHLATPGSTHAAPPYRRTSAWATSTNTTLGRASFRTCATILVQDSFAPAAALVPLAEMKVDLALAMRNWDYSWEPTLMQGPVPSNATWIEAPVALFLLPAAYLTTNFGHMVCLTCSACTQKGPVFSLLDMFSLYSKGARLMLLSEFTCKSPLCKDPAAPGSAETVSLSDYANHFRDTDGIVSKLFASPILYPKNFSSTTCFANLLIGTGALYPQRYPMRSRLLHQAFVAGNVKRRNEPVSHLRSGLLPRDKSFRVTILNRISGRRIVENMMSIASELSKIKKALVTVLNFTDTASPTLSEQMYVLEHTDLLISPGGAIACGLIFLRQGATALVFNYYDPVRNGTYNLDEHNFGYVEHVEVKYIPVGPGDYEGTADRASCHVYADWRGPLVGCNLKLHNVFIVTSMVQEIMLAQQF